MAKLPRKTIWILIALAYVSLGVYLVASQAMFGIGFPLDDAWIHQTYARNLAETGSWAFHPGQPSGGSTAPLWSLLLSIGFVTHLGPYVWTYLLGGACLAGMAVGVEFAFRKIAPGASHRFAWAGLIILSEWHLVWSAGSGMETLLMALLITGSLLLIAMRQFRWCLLGALAGIAVWVRPDGVTLLGPICLAAWVYSPGFGHKWRNLGKVFLCFLAAFIPYLVFNRVIAGTWWPNTYYAKQTEYAILQEMPLWLRFLNEAKLPLIGVGVLFLPGVVVFAWQAVKSKDWAKISGILWWLGYVALYAWRLPVTYQHGRYLMPAMPIFFFWGMVGTVRSIQGLNRMRLGQVVRKAWVISIAVIAAAFWGIGAVTYARDVAIIETEMVASARWVAANTNPQDLIAAHDIGALGYFGKRQIIDLAGLNTPEVIPFMRDENQLANYLSAQNVDYLVTFPDWYPQLVRSVQPLFETGGSFAPSLGQPNMAVYRWNKRP